MTGGQLLGVLIVMVCGFLIVRVWTDNKDSPLTLVVGTLFYGLFLLGGLQLFVQADRPASRLPSRPVVQVPDSTLEPGFVPGYENPAPGDDGSFDCAPGQGPVIVAPGDPNNLDRDGDGIGCE